MSRLARHGSVEEPLCIGTETIVAYLLEMGLSLIHI